jgi:hypothetical protein
MQTQVVEEVRAIYISRSGRDALEAFAQEPRFKDKQMGRLLMTLVAMWDSAESDEEA